MHKNAGVNFHMSAGSVKMELFKDGHRAEVDLTHHHPTEQGHFAMAALEWKKGGYKGPFPLFA